MCGVQLKSRTTRLVLNSSWLGTECITVVRRSRLQWFGHVKIKESDNWVSACRSFDVNGVRDRGRKT